MTADACVGRLGCGEGVCAGPQQVSHGSVSGRAEQPRENAYHDGCELIRVREEQTVFVATT